MALISMSEWIDRFGDAGTRCAPNEYLSEHAEFRAPGRSTLTLESLSNSSTSLNCDILITRWPFSSATGFLN